MRPLLFLSIILLMSCSKEDDDNRHTVATCIAYCESRPMDVFLPAEFYTANELSTVIVREYTGDGTFSNLLNEQVDTTGNDTMRSNLDYDAPGNILAINVYGDSSDFEIVIPGAGQTYRISNVAPTTKSEDWNCGSGGHYQCSFPVKDYTITGGNSSLKIYQGHDGFHYTIRLQH